MKKVMTAVMAIGLAAGLLAGGEARAWVCGDFYCNVAGGENGYNCPQDCDDCSQDVRCDCPGTVCVMVCVPINCGDHVCVVGENSGNCPADCIAGSPCGCVDWDGDGRGSGCYSGGDCNDYNRNTWSTCSTCKDLDADGWYQLCNAYSGILGPDCDDNAATGGGCHAGCSSFYQDADADGYGNPSSSFSRCVVPAGCVADNTDCDDNAATGASCHAGCLTFYRDSDNDGYGAVSPTTLRCVVPAGYAAGNTDCSDANPNAWDTCSTCKDADIDSWYANCNRYQTVSGPDCDDGLPFAWNACPTCRDDDGDSWYEQCDLYALKSVSTTGTGNNSWNYPISTYSHDARTQVIYPASVIGRAGAITSLALDVTAIPGQVLTSFTIRMKHTTLASYAPAAWDGPDSGWTTVYQADEPRGTTGWRTFTLTTPFVYDGLSNLMVDFSFNNSSYTSNGACRYSYSSAYRSAYYYTNSAYGDPLNWTGTSGPAPFTSNYVPNLRISFAESAIAGPECDDANATVYPAAPEVCDGIDNQCPGDPGSGEVDEGCPVDGDADGLNDFLETTVYFTDPAKADTDGDGIGDGDEVNLLGTLPTAWDSDADALPDGFEAAHAALDPLNALDALQDPDADGNPTRHEYYNESDPWTVDPVPQAGYDVGCYFWGKSDAGPFVQPKDITAIQNAYVGREVELSGVLPSSYDPLDLDRSGWPDPADVVIAQKMYVQVPQPAGYASSPAALTVTDAPSAAVAVGSTTHVTVSVEAQGPGSVLYSSGFGVVFWVSSGNATLLGGDGADPAEAPGNRYDVSMSAASGAPASIVILVTGPGPVILNAKIPACGTEPLGRWCAEVPLSSPVVINP